MVEIYLAASRGHDKPPRKRGKHAIHVCCFSSLDELTYRQRRSSVEVLRALQAVGGRFSTFEATEKPLCHTLMRLLRQDLIRLPEPQPGYPWCRAELTPTGEALLNEHANRSAEPRYEVMRPPPS